MMHTCYGLAADGIRSVLATGICLADEQAADSFHCCICFDDHPAEERFVVMACQHSFCGAGARALALSAIRCMEACAKRELDGCCREQQQSC